MRYCHPPSPWSKSFTPLFNHPLCLRKKSRLLTLHQWMRHHQTNRWILLHHVIGMSAPTRVSFLRMPTDRSHRLPARLTPDRACQYVPNVLHKHIRLLQKWKPRPFQPCLNPKKSLLKSRANGLLMSYFNIHTFLHFVNVLFHWLAVFRLPTLFTRKP